MLKSPVHKLPRRFGYESRVRKPVMEPVLFQIRKRDDQEGIQVRIQGVVAFKNLNQDVNDAHGDEAAKLTESTRALNAFFFKSVRLKSSIVL